MEFAKQLQALAKHEKSEEMDSILAIWEPSCKKYHLAQSPAASLEFLDKAWFSKALNLFKKGLKMHLKHILMTFLEFSWILKYFKRYCTKYLLKPFHSNFPWTSPRLEEVDMEDWAKIHLPKSKDWEVVSSVRW